MKEIKRGEESNYGRKRGLIGKRDGKCKLIDRKGRGL